MPPTSVDIYFHVRCLGLYHPLTFAWAQRNSLNCAGPGRAARLRKGQHLATNCQLHVFLYIYIYYYTPLPLNLANNKQQQQQQQHVSVPFWPLHLPNASGLTVL